MKEASEKLTRMTREEYNRTLDEEEKKMDAELANTKKNFSSFGNIEEPNEEEQEEKMKKFRQFLFSDAKKISTPQLLSQIVQIINNTYIDEVKTRNEESENNLSANVIDSSSNLNNSDVNKSQQNSNFDNNTVNGEEKKYK